MKRGLKIGIAALAVLLAGGWGIRFYQLNQAYPQAEVQTYQTGEKIAYDDFTFTVNGYRIVEQSELEAGGFMESLMLPEQTNRDYNHYDVKGLFVDMTIEYTGTEKKSFPIYIFNLEHDSWNTGLDMEWMGGVNEGGLDVSFEAGEKRDFIVPYNLFDVQFPKKVWEHIEEKKFRLIFSLYPENRIVEL